MTRIEQALIRLFDRHRIVFWYDAKLEFRNDFETPVRSQAQPHMQQANFSEMHLYWI